MQICQIWNRAN